MALTSEELEEMPKAIQSAFSDLELKIIEDLVGRIKKNNEITGTGEWDIFQLIRMGESKKVIKNYVAKTLKLTYSEIENIFGDVFETGYNRDNALYMAVGADFIAYRDNKPLQQYIGAVKEQTKGTYKNITNTMGFVRQRQGTKTWVPLTKYYKDTLSRAVFEITSGAFSYNQVIKRTINEMTNSGLRTIDYASGRTSRIEVAAMRAIRTAITQVTAKVTEQNMEKLHTDYVEVSWHATARPTHQVWQGRVFKWNRNNDADNKTSDNPNVSNILDITKEFISEATPNKGNMVLDVGINKEDENLTKWMFKKLGGDLHCIAENSQIGKIPDAKRNGIYWEFKSPTSINAIEDRIKKANRQLSEVLKRENNENAERGMLIDISNMKNSEKETLNKIFKEINMRCHHPTTVIIKKNDDVLQVIKKK